MDLRGTPDGVTLAVRDAGVGFGVEEAKNNGGLGLASMQERINLVHGALSIESRQGEGTRIVATVPVPDEESSSATAKSHAPSLAEAE